MKKHLNKQDQAFARTMRSAHRGLVRIRAEVKKLEADVRALLRGPRSKLTKYTRGG